MIKSLEKEFKRYSELHSKMVFALALVHKPDTYNYLDSQEINTHSEFKGEERLSKTLDEITKLRGQEIFNTIYTKCWEVAKEHLDNKDFFKTRIY